MIGDVYMLEKIYYFTEDIYSDVKKTKLLGKYLKEKSLNGIFKILMTLIVDVTLINVIIVCFVYNHLFKIFKTKEKHTFDNYVTNNFYRFYRNAY